MQAIHTAVLVLTAAAGLGAFASLGDGFREAIAGRSTGQGSGFRGLAVVALRPVPGPTVSTNAGLGGVLRALGGGGAHAGDALRFDRGVPAASRTAFRAALAEPTTGASVAAWLAEGGSIRVRRAANAPPRRSLASFLEKDRANGESLHPRWQRYDESSARSQIRRSPSGAWELTLGADAVPANLLGAYVERARELRAAAHAETTVGRTLAEAILGAGHWGRIPEAAFQQRPALDALMRDVVHFDAPIRASARSVLYQADPMLWAKMKREGVSLRFVEDGAREGWFGTEARVSARDADRSLRWVRPGTFRVPLQEIGSYAEARGKYGHAATALPAEGLPDWNATDFALARARAAAVTEEERALRAQVQQHRALPPDARERLSAHVLPSVRADRAAAIARMNRRAHDVWIPASQGRTLGP